MTGKNSHARASDGLRKRGSAKPSKVEAAGGKSPAEPASKKARPAQDIVGSAQNSILTGPTYLTILRMILSVVFMIFALLPYHWSSIIALIIFIAAAITDKIDGIWARKHDLVTDLGAFLDPLADKMLVDLAFLVLVYIGIVPLWVFAIILVRDLAVDGMRMMAARTGVTIAASFLGKLKTTVQMTALITLLSAIVLQNDIIHILGLIALYLALALTVLSGADYLIKGYKEFIK